MFDQRQNSSCGAFPQRENKHCSKNIRLLSSLFTSFYFSLHTKSIAEVYMDWISDFLDPAPGCVRQDPDSGFLNKNRIRTGFGFCNLLVKNGL